MNERFAKETGRRSAVEVCTEVVLLLPEADIEPAGTVSGIGVEDAELALVVEVDLDAVEHVPAHIARNAEPRVADIEPVLAVVEAYFQLGFHRPVYTRDIRNLAFIFCAGLLRWNRCVGVVGRLRPLSGVPGFQPGSMPVAAAGIS